MSLSDTFKTCLGIRKSETVLLLTDTDMGKVAGVIKDAVESWPGELIFVSMAPRQVHGAEPPRAVATAMAASDVIIAATSKSLTHTLATKNAVEHGSRVASMPGVTVEMLTKGGMTADYREVAYAARRVAAALTQGRTIEIKTSAGTDFKASISGRQGYADTGLLTKKGDFGNLPGGEGFIAPLEGNSEGRIVFDGPIASSGLSHEPTVVDVENGRATYTGYEGLSKIFKDVKDASNVAEIGIGVNPEARLTGNVLEDEKVLGTAHVAFGNNVNFGGKINAKIHIDGIIKDPTISVDGKVIAKKGALLLV